MAHVRRIRDQQRLRALEATFAVFFDVCDDASADEARKSLEAILARQSAHESAVELSA